MSEIYTQHDRYVCPRCGWSSDEPGACADPWCGSNYWIDKEPAATLVDTEAQDE